MNVAYAFGTSSHIASDEPGGMILHRLRDDRHTVKIVGKLDFDCNTFVLRTDDRLALERGLATSEVSATVDQVAVRSFPDLDAALAGNSPDLVTTL